MKPAPHSIMCRNHNLSPLSHWKVKAGDKVGVVGLGGLGHMELSSHALGAHVVMITTSPEKEKMLND
jgi:uncharacterized zinc-type alcohol dehydrogenase-like protein